MERPFAYNNGAPIPGTAQIGDLAIGYPDSGFVGSGLKWWNGPDEDLGYVIAKPDPSGSHIGADGEAAYLGFHRSLEKTEGSLISLVESLYGQTFITGSAAKSWLNSNGYWTSFGETAGVVGGSFAFTLVTLPYNPPSSGNIIFPFAGVSTTEGILDPNTFVDNSVYWSTEDSIIFIHD